MSGKLICFDAENYDHRHHNEGRLVQQTFAEHLKKALGWEGVYAYNAETLEPAGMLGRASERDVVLVGAGKAGHPRSCGKSKLR
jgi:hypothetical protein